MSGSKRISVLVVLLLLTGAVSVSAATGFVNPPDFTPQRMLLWDFADQATWQTPVTAIGPTWDEGAWTCDDVTVTGAIQWMDTDPNWPGKQGMLGIVNDTQGVLSGSVTFHINNYADLNNLKRMAFEYEYLLGINSGISSHIELPEGFEVATGNWDFTNLFPGERVNWNGTIEPNPSWEEIRITLNADPGSVVFFDKLYVATECVPEPSSILALSGGLIGLLGVARRRRI